MQNTRYSDALPKSDLLSEQTRRLYSSMPTLNVLEPLMVFGIIWMYWSTDVDSGLLINWGIAMLALCFTRVSASLLFRNLSSDLSSMRAWRLFVMLLMGLSGFIFTYGITRFTPPDSILTGEYLPFQVVSITMLVGLSIVVITSYAIYFPAAFAFLASAMAVLSQFLLSSDTDYGAMLSILILLSSLFLVMTAIGIHRRAMDNLRLQYKNFALINYLDRARSEAESLNEKLTGEISERRQAKRRLQDTNDRLEQMVQERTNALANTNRELSSISQRLQLALDVSNIGLWDWNLESGETYHSNFDSLLGYAEGRFQSFINDLEPIVHPSDMIQIKRSMVRHFKGLSARYQAIYRAKHANGGWRWIEDEGQVVEWNRDNKASRMIGTRRDITEEKEAEKQLQLAATVFENASDAILILDTDFNYLAVNDCFTRITGYSDEDVTGKHPKEVLDEQQKPILRETTAPIMSGLNEEGFWQGELKAYRKSGEYFPVWLQMSAVYDESGSVTHYVGMFSDLTARKQAEEKLQFLSNFDRLTGLPNRTMFQEKLEQSLVDARLGRSRLALAYLDLDRFRPINDSLGHELGDKLLQAAADRLRTLDIDEANLARINADEFCLIIENIADDTDVERLCNDALNVIRRPFNISGHELSLGLSVGISIFPDNAKEAKTLINQADLAVHQAKRQGGNIVQHYRTDMRSVSVEQLALETSLRKAIFKNEFILHFQPKLDLASGKINACEALVRWQHPTMGLLFPNAFIPLAEESGLISAIGEWVLERACRQGAIWANEGTPIKVAVNLSAHQLRKGDLVEVVTRVLEITGLHPSLLELELTESLIVEDLEKNIETLNQIRQLGVQLSLDDFGTGYSSLSYLKRFPVSTLKIDRAFIMDLHTSKGDAAITQAIIDMAHNMNMYVVAEGIELKEQLDVLIEMKCDSIQGFYISKAVPPKDMMALVDKQRKPAQG